MTQLTQPSPTFYKFLTPSRINALRAEAASHGDEAMVETCDRALDDDYDARLVAAASITAARAVDVDPTDLIRVVLDDLPPEDDADQLAQLIRSLGDYTPEVTGQRGQDDQKVVCQGVTFYWDGQCGVLHGWCWRFDAPGDGDMLESVEELAELLVDGNGVGPVDDDPGPN